jgi:hypothetical protein
MPFSIEGWVEVSRRGSPAEQAWESLIRIGSLIDVADEVSERLFGLSKRSVSAEAAVAAVAAGRGVPPNHSTAVRGALAELADHERQFGTGEVGGYTFMTWAEVKAAEIEPAVIEKSQWSLLFDLICRLEEDTRFSDDLIRFVVWYNW